MASSDHPAAKDLANAIRSGAKRRPQQAFGDYFVGQRASCALGAAYEGIYRLPAEMDGKRPTEDLTRIFDCLEGIVLWCPVEGCKRNLLLSAMVVHLNDQHAWSRETIATWIERLNIQPSER